MSEAADVTRAIRSLTDEDAAARPAGVRRAKPVVVEDEDEPEAEAKPTAERVADEPDEAVMALVLRAKSRLMLQLKPV